LPTPMNPTSSGCRPTIQTGLVLRGDLLWIAGRIEEPDSAPPSIQ
jgi:hypothetical protein